MVSINDLKELLLYKKKFFLPIDPKDKRHGSAVLLLTPNIQSSELAMTAPYIVNKLYFESYYVEKSITGFIQNESVRLASDNDRYIIEADLSTKERNELKDSDFGLPSQRKYPLNDKEHVLLAIKFFNYVKKENEEELASNIIKAVEKLFTDKEAAEINVGKNNRFMKYWEKSKYYKEDSTTNESAISESVSEEYFNEYVSNAMDNLSAKIKKSKIVFSGFDNDIKAVYKYFKRDSLDICFERINLKKPPEKVTISISSDPLTDTQFYTDGFTIYTPKALKKRYSNIDYEDYIDFSCQLYAIYQLKPKNGYKNNPGKILDSIAEPAAVLLSGIADKEIAKDKNNDNYGAERIFKYIIDTAGIKEFIEIIASNDIAAIYSYSKAYGKNRIEHKKFFESVDIIQEESELLNEEEKSSSEEITLKDPIPSSIKAIQRMGTSLKRRIRQHSLYALNKITRDLERGNNGIESRGLTTLQQLQTGNIVSTPGAPIAASVEQFEMMSNGDYITEGDFIYLFENSDKYDIALRKALFKERFKTNKQVLDFYKKVKTDLPFIKFAYTELSRYRNRNLFVDMSHYNESFFRNVENLNSEDRLNTTRIFKMYLELLERLVKDNAFKSYTKKTIFIPILDWRHNNSTKMWIYREDINPISAMYYMMKYDLGSLKKVFGDNDIIFLGAKNYFKVNFSSTDFSNAVNVSKFLSLVRRIVNLGYNSPADPDPEGELEDSPSGIAMDIIDKIEKSQNVSIDNLSGLESLKKSIDLIQTPKLGTEEEIDAAVKTDAIAVDPSKLSGDITTIQTAKKVTTKDYSTSSRGKTISVPVKVKKKVITKAANKAAIGTAADTKSVNTTSEKDKKDAIVNAVAKAADNSTSVDDALNTLNTDKFKEMILALQNDSEENVRVDKTRASAVVAAQNEFHKKEVAGKSVQDLLDTDRSKEELKESKLKVASINEDWKHMTFVNFDKDYDVNSDIIKMLDSMQHWTFPIAVKNIDIKDNSTSEDILDLWTIECVDYKNAKFTLKVDVPKFIDGSNFLKLRGNEKTMMIQSVLLPIIKTALDECQIISSGGYNKILVSIYGSRKGQSSPASNKILRAISKYMKGSDKSITISVGDNKKVCAKYELPIDYIDLSRSFNFIQSNTVKIYFNQDDIRSEYEVDDTKGIPIGIKSVVNDKTKEAIQTIIYFDSNNAKTFGTLSAFIAYILAEDCPEFAKIYNALPAEGRYTYSKAKILDCMIPIVVICGYLEGLIPTMNKAGIEYQFVQEIDRSIRNSDSFDYIRFADGYLQYKVNYSSSLLMNGLKENDTESFSISDVNNRRMYYEFLSNYGTGGPIGADGLENSYDCMIDPITKEILEKFKLPTDYIGVLIHSSNILADNKYVRHIDQAGRRWRRKELIAGYFYKALTQAYQEYASSIRHTRKNSKMAMKQSAIIDLIVSKDPATTDLSINNALNDLECSNTVTNKGLVGMNIDRGYTINTRGYDDTMLNLLGMDTGFSGNVGINRQATINANIEGGRGFVKTIDNDTNKLSTASSFTITESVTPFGSTHDDPPRTLMTYIQTSKHMIRCDNNDPLLVTTGADEALPYLVSNIFAYKAKKNGKVIELVEEGFGKKNYMVIEYEDGTHDFVNLSEVVKKNSDGGYYVPMKLDTELTIGTKVKAGDVVAYDKLSFSKSLGESGNLAMNVGTLAKIAIINTDEGFEDSAAVTESFAEKIGTWVIQGIDTRLDKGSNIFINKEIGDPVMEGDTLFSYQTDFDDDVVNTLLKNLSMDQEQLSELGRTPVKSKYTGIVSDIVIYRTCKEEDMSPSLRSFVSKYENKIKDIKSIYDKYGIDSAVLPKTGKVPEIGKTKNLDDGVLVIYYIKYNDRLSVGDKIVFYSANKGIIKYIIPKQDEPYTEFRPNEHVDSFMSLSSISGRMTCSIVISAATNKLMVELDRSIKDLAGIPYDESKL